MKIELSNNVEEIEIERNGEPAGKIEISLSDPTLLARLRSVRGKVQEIQEKSRLNELTDDLDASLEEAERIDREMKDVLDWAFGAKVSDVAFGDSFCFATDCGVTMMEQFLAGVTPGIEKAFKAELKAAEERQDKYLSKYK